MVRWGSVDSRPFLADASSSLVASLILNWYIILALCMTEFTSTRLSLQQRDLADTQCRCVVGDPGYHQDARSTLGRYRVLSNTCYHLDRAQSLSVGPLRKGTFSPPVGDSVLVTYVRALSLTLSDVALAPTQRLRRLRVWVFRYDRVCAKVQLQSWTRVHHWRCGQGCGLRLWLFFQRQMASWLLLQ